MLDSFCLALNNLTGKIQIHLYSVIIHIAFC